MTEKKKRVYRMGGTYSILDSSSFILVLQELPCDEGYFERCIVLTSRGNTYFAQFDPTWRRKIVAELETCDFSSKSEED